MSCPTNCSPEFSTRGCASSVESAELSIRPRQLVRDLRSLNPLARATLAGDEGAAGTLALLLESVPMQDGQSIVGSVAGAGMLAMLDDGFVPHPDCEPDFAGELKVLSAAFLLDRAAGADLPPETSRSVRLTRARASVDTRRKRRADPQLAARGQYEQPAATGERSESGS